MKNQYRYTWSRYTKPELDTPAPRGLGVLVGILALVGGAYVIMGIIYVIS